MEKTLRVAGMIGGALLGLLVGCCKGGKIGGTIGELKDQYDLLHKDGDPAEDSAE